MIENLGILKIIWNLQVFALVQGFLWEFDEFAISEDFVKVFCDNVFVGSGQKETSVYYFDFFFGAFEYPTLDIESQILLGTVPENLCDFASEAENLLFLSGYSARFLFSEEEIGLGLQSSSYLRIGQLEIPILYKSSPNFLILSQWQAEETLSDYEIIAGTSISQDIFVFSDILICKTCNFLMNVRIGSILKVYTDQGIEIVNVKNIIDTDVVVVFPRIQRKTVEDLYVIVKNFKVFHSFGEADVYGKVVFFDGIAEVGDFVIVSEEVGEETVFFWDKMVNEVVFAGVGVVVLAENVVGSGFIHLLKGDKLPSACPISIEFSNSNRFTTYSSQCTRLDFSDFIISFTVSSSINTIFIDFNSEIPLFRVLLGPVSYIFSYSDYSIQSFQTPFTFSELLNTKIYFSFYKSVLYLSKFDHLTDLLLKFQHKDLEKIMNFSIQCFDNGTVSEIQIEKIPEKLENIFKDLPNIGKNLFANQVKLELKNGEKCGESLHKTTVEFICGEDLELKSVTSPHDCIHEILISTPLLCPDFSKEYSLLGPTILLEKTY